MTQDRPSNLPQLLRDAERRVNEHVFGDRRALVSIPADVSRDVDILLLTAADEIERLDTAMRAAADELKAVAHDRDEWKRVAAHRNVVIATLGEENERLQADLEKATLAAIQSGSLAEFQNRVRDWMDACFGPEISKDRTERNHRFLEESLELVQAGGCSRSEALQLVDYVYGRPVGQMPQEVGGVMVTLAALCGAFQLDMQRCAEDEITRIWICMPEIRAKQAGKPKCSPLPESPTTDHHQV